MGALITLTAPVTLPIEVSLFPPSLLASRRPGCHLVAPPYCSHQQPLLRGCNESCKPLQANSASAGVCSPPPRRPGHGACRSQATEQSPSCQPSLRPSQHPKSSFLWISVSMKKQKQKSQGIPTLENTGFGLHIPIVLFWNFLYPWCMGTRTKGLWASGRTEASGPLLSWTSQPLPLRWSHAQVLGTPSPCLATQCLSRSSK